MTRIDSPPDFEARHLGPDADDVRAMLEVVGYDSLEALIDDVIPASIRMEGDLDLPEPLTEAELLVRLRSVASENRVMRSFLGMGYSDTHVPGVIQRNILENPGWYTQYTPYQAEIAQGRLEALLNYQTMIIDLTGLEIANASLLDEATAAAEAMHLAHGEAVGSANRFFVSELCHPQTIDVVRPERGRSGSRWSSGITRSSSCRTRSSGFFSSIRPRTAACSITPSSRAAPARSARPS